MLITEDIPQYSPNSLPNRIGELLRKGKIKIFDKGTVAQNDK